MIYQVDEHPELKREMREVMNAPCPDCGGHHATVIYTQLYTHGVKHEGYSRVIDCAECGCHEWEMIGPDI